MQKDRQKKFQTGKKNKWKRYEKENKWKILGKESK